MNSTCKSVEQLTGLALDYETICESVLACEFRIVSRLPADEQAIDKSYMSRIRSWFIYCL